MEGGGAVFSWRGVCRLEPRWRGGGEGGEKSKESDICCGRSV